MRLEAMGLVGVGLWHAFFTLTPLHRIGWLQLFVACLSFGLAMLVWKR